MISGGFGVQWVEDSEEESDNPKIQVAATTVLPSDMVQVRHLVAECDTNPTFTMTLTCG